MGEGRGKLLPLSREEAEQTHQLKFPSPLCLRANSLPHELSSSLRPDIPGDVILTAITNHANSERMYDLDCALHQMIIEVVRV